MVYECLGKGMTLGLRKMGTVLPVDQLGIFGPTDEPSDDAIAKVAATLHSLNYIEPDSLAYPPTDDGYELLGKLIERLKAKSGKEFVALWPPSGPVGFNTDTQHYANRYLDDAAWKAVSYAVYRAAWTFKDGVLQRTRYSSAVKYFSTEQYFNPSVAGGLPAGPVSAAYRSSIRVGSLLARIFGRDFCPFFKAFTGMTPEALGVTREFNPRLYWDDVVIPPDWLAQINRV